VSDPKIVNLAEARAARDVQRLIEARERVDERVRWSIHPNTSGGLNVHLEVDTRGEETWTLSFPITLAQAEKLRRDIDEARFYARQQRDVADGVVHLTWCAVDGRRVACPVFGGVPARVVGRVTGGVHLQLALALVPGAQEPRYGWPPSGLYSLATGAHVDTLPRRRHWRIGQRDLEVLRAKEADHG
jgi:hypothetical protein